MIGPAQSASGRRKNERAPVIFMRPIWHRKTHPLLPVGSNFNWARPTQSRTQEHASIGSEPTYKNGAVRREYQKQSPKSVRVFASAFSMGVWVKPMNNAPTRYADKTDVLSVHTDIRPMVRFVWVDCPSKVDRSAIYSLRSIAC